ncbi:MAG: hypothetical protein KIT33_06845 [Candidatus Kapabacteria bacterium]|nr:hypothetical protein [Ignavibacteriota bacterium]MCW5884673.1 hypothetical protein [Candidatus Kapabacteria bacterium]
MKTSYVILVLFLISNLNLISETNSIEFSKSDLPVQNTVFTELGAEVTDGDVILYFSPATSIALNNPSYKLDSANIKIGSTRGILKWKPFDGLTMVGQVFGSVIGTAFGTLASLGIIAVLDRGFGMDYYSGEQGLLGIVLGFLGGVAIGSPTGIWIAGKAFGGNGSYGLTLLSGIIGTGIWIGTGLGAYNFNLPVLALTNMVLPIIVYHSTASPVYNKSSQSVDLNINCTSYSLMPINITRMEILKINF